MESSGFFATPFSTTSILGFLSLCDNTVLFDAFVSLWPKFNPTHPVGDRVYVTLKADIVMKARQYKQASEDETEVVFQDSL